jgi:hypothetical protein
MQMNANSRNGVEKIKSSIIGLHHPFLIANLSEYGIFDHFLSN